MKEPEWLVKATLITIHEEQLAEHGGAEGIREEAVLEPALAWPLNQFAYAPSHCDIFSLAATYAFGLARNHPFVDGNKRTSLVATETFLVLNGYGLSASEAEKVVTWQAIADGTLDEDRLTAWVRDHAERRC